MNDSFLEDLDLVTVEQKTGNAINHAERYVTTRQCQSISTRLCTDRDELDTLIKQQHHQQHKKQKHHKLTSPLTITLNKPLSDKKLIDDYSPSSDMYCKKKQNDVKDKVQLETKKSTREHKNHVNVRAIDKKVKNSDDKLITVESVDRCDNIKSSLSSNDGKKYTTGSRESSRLSDGSSKENSRPSESSSEAIGNIEVMKEWRRISNDCSKKKSDINDDRNESVVMLNAIKDIVSSYTKMESSKIMRMMQDHYINSQANLIKQFVIMTDGNNYSYHHDNNVNSSRVQTLINENMRLHEHVTFLKNRIEELQNAAESIEKIRHENTALKLKIKELEK